MTDIQDWLDEGKALADQATQGPWEAEESSDGWTEIYGRDPIEPITPTVATTERGGDTEAAFIADARTRLPQALAAIQAVMEIHKPFQADHYYNGMDGESLHRFVLRCDGCEKSGGIEDYPCPTVQAIQTELERKETQS